MLDVVLMAQININTTPEFERDLRTLMRKRKIPRKSDAIRYAVRVAAHDEDKRRDFEALLGALDKFPDNPQRRFTSEDALWADE
jgi:hypothetical protein